MEAPFKQISKQVNKIIRILTKVSEEHPKISKEIDLALYASIKIQKIVNKYLEGQASNHHLFQTKINQYQITRNSDSEDAFFTTAMQSIQNFKNSTFKLQRKINVLINQEEYKIKKSPSNQSVYPITTQTIRSKMNNNQPLKPEKKRPIKRQKYTQHQQQEQSQQSRNLRSLDQSIIKIVNNIKLMQGGELPSNYDQQQ